MQNSFRPRLEQQCRFLMDTFVTIYAYGCPKTISGTINQAFERMQQIAIKFNAHNPDSPIYAFNQQSKPIRDKEVLKLIRIALDISQKSKGAFDITIYPLLKLWGFYTKSMRLPPEEEIKNCLGNIGYRHLILNDNELKKDNLQVNIDLGAIAKGYAVAEAVKVLKEEGITSALIDAGGDVYALGTKRGRPWKVGIQHPRKKGLLGYVEVTNMAVMGSGDYQRFFTKGGRRYHHIFNPKTGHPATGVSAVNVICPDPVLADAWATALFVLGPGKGLEVVKRIPDMEAVMVTTDGRVLYSAGAGQLLKTGS
jgi:thiamine biosynthesis lipoprotein